MYSLDMIVGLHVHRQITDKTPKTHYRGGGGGGGGGAKLVMQIGALQQNLKVHKENRILFFFMLHQGSTLSVKRNLSLLHGETL